MQNGAASRIVGSNLVHVPRRNRTHRAQSATCALMMEPHRDVRALSHHRGFGSWALSVAASDLHWHFRRVRSRLETLKEIMAAKSGEAISTSETAKQLLESAKEDRLEFVNLLSEPTDSLMKIRKPNGPWLPTTASRVRSYFADTGQTKISYESLTGILEAFPAVYGLVYKQRRRSPMAPYLLTNLPSERQMEAKLQKRLPTMTCGGR